MTVSGRCAMGADVRPAINFRGRPIAVVLARHRVARRARARGAQQLVASNVALVAPWASTALARRRLQAAALA
jgi:hypothetical protein